MGNWVDCLSVRFRDLKCLILLKYVNEFFWYSNTFRVEDFFCSYIEIKPFTFLQFLVQIVRNNNKSKYWIEVEICFMDLQKYGNAHRFSFWAYSVNMPIWKKICPLAKMGIWNNLNMPIILYFLHIWNMTAWTGLPSRTGFSNHELMSLVKLQKLPNFQQKKISSTDGTNRFTKSK